MAQGRGQPFWNPHRVTAQKSKCSLGLTCWGLWFFWACLWAQVRVWLLPGKVLVQNQHLVPDAWVWSNKKKDQGVPGVWGGPRMPANTADSSRGVPEAGSPACASDEEVNSADALCNAASALQGAEAMPPQIGLLLHWDLPLWDSATQSSWRWSFPWAQANAN